MNKFPLNQLNKVPPPAHDIAPDLELELMHWRTVYPDAPCFRARLGFERYVATLKFGYDTFLLNHTKGEDELFPALCHRYKDGVAACDRIDWVEARMIVAATWERMRNSALPPVTAGQAPITPFPQAPKGSLASGLQGSEWFLSQAGLHASPTRAMQAAVR